MGDESNHRAGGAPGSSAGPPAEAPLDEQRGRVVLAVVTLSSFFVPFMSSATNVALPQIALELGIDAPLLPWVNTSYMLAAAALLLPLGRVADLRSKRAMFVGGIFAFAAITAVLAAASSQFMLLALRLFQGGLGAVPLAASLPLLIAVWPPQTRGRAVGVTITGVYTGLSVGPVAGGFLTHALGWRSIFLITAGLAVAIGIVAALRLPRDEHHRTGERFDVPGSVLSALALCALMLGLTRLPHADGITLLVHGVAALVGFLVWELRAKSPLFDVRLFAGNRVFLFSNLAALVNYSATAGVAFLLSLYLQRVKGMDPRGAGLVLVVQPALMALLSAPAGRLSERIEPRRLSTAGMLLTTAGLALLAFLGTDTPMWMVILALAMLGVAFATFSSPNTNAVMSSVDKRRLGIASAILGTMRSVGMMFSLGLCGLLFALMIGYVPMAQIPLDDFVHVVRTAFAVFAGLCFLGVFASNARGTVHG